MRSSKGLPGKPLSIKEDEEREEREGEEQEEETAEVALAQQPLKS